MEVVSRLTAQRSFLGSLARVDLFFPNSGQAAPVTISGSLALGSDLSRAGQGACADPTSSVLLLFFKTILSLDL